jgi:hypothetical protein
MSLINVAVGVPPSFPVGAGGGEVLLAVAALVAAGAGLLTVAGWLSRRLGPAPYVPRYAARTHRRY